MAQNKINKLELTWIGKDEEPLAVEPRLLIETPKHSFGEVETGTLPNGKPWKGNMLIHGDNLLALKALEQDFAGQVKCIFIDPPYNIDAANEHYDDFVEHSKWLSLIKPRLEILRNLLDDRGAIFIQIGDEEQAYLKVLCDEVFGRSNFLNMISVNMKSGAGASGGGEDKRLKKNCEFILVYAKKYAELVPFIPIYDYREMYNVVESYRKLKISWHYNSVLVDEGEREYVTSTYDGEGNEIKIFSRKNAIIKSIRQVMADENITEKETYYKYANRIFEAKDAQSSIRTRVKDAKKEKGILDDVVSIEYIPRSGKNKGKVYEQFYKGDSCRLFAWLGDIGEFIDGILYKKERQGTYWNMTSYLNNLTKEGTVLFPNGKKPEALINRIFEMCTASGDLVLDSFLGSGTTAAVAHKMGRRWIGVELGDHAYTHCAVRMRKVIEGEQGGISKSQNWRGGGGFKFYELAPSLLNHDKYGNLVINKEYNADMLAAAMAKHQGFTYSPDAELYWKQGHSSEHDFIFTTTQLLTVEMLESIHEQLDENESLLICCSKFQPGCRDKHANITIKKIPKVLLDTCEFDRDDYSLNIVSMPDGIEDEEWDDSQDSSETEISEINLKEKTLFD
ncbi:MAG: site-specific DNA-methyltransferase [Prevotella sp.]|nr:site-specific DNA-methyltransferase [Prevotella sp.]